MSDDDFRSWEEDNPLREYVHVHDLTTGSVLGLVDPANGEHHTMPPAIIIELVGHIIENGPEDAPELDHHGRYLLSQGTALSLLQLVTKALTEARSTQANRQ